VTAPASFTWDGAAAYLPPGTMLDVPPGSALETAIGLGNLSAPADPGAAAAHAGASN
jgi:hypothetical protein